MNTCCSLGLSGPHVDNNEEEENWRVSRSRSNVTTSLFCFVTVFSVSCVVWVLLTKCNDMINVGSA